MTKLDDQLYINSLLVTTTAATTAQAAAQEGKRLAKQMANSLSMENSRLKCRVEDLEEENKQQEKIIIAQKMVLRDWIVSQTAFRNLFKRYGKLDDGTPVTSLGEEQKKQLLEQAEIDALDDPFAKEKIQNLQLP